MDVITLLAETGTATLPAWTAVFPVLAALIVVLTFVWKGLRSVWRTLRRANETIDAFQDIIQEWKGQAASNGDPGRPSMPVRFANMEREVIRQGELLTAHIRQHPSATRRLTS